MLFLWISWERWKFHVGIYGLFQQFEYLKKPKTSSICVIEIHAKIGCDLLMKAFSFVIIWTFFKILR